VERVLELTEGHGVDIVYDATLLESSFGRSIEVLKEGSTWIVLGHLAQEGSKEAKSIAERKAKYIRAALGPYWVGPERAQLKTFVQNTLKQGVKWIDEGKLKPYICQIIKLEEAKDALDQIKQGTKEFGKIVVKLL